jgi:hypothetical protein
MANFDDQVMGLTGLTISGSSTAPSQSELTQFLTDGAKEIINILPSNLKEKCSTETTLDNTTTVMDMDGVGEILYVTRENADSGYHTPCRRIPSMYGGLTTDSSNIIHYATSTDPVYWVESQSDSSKLVVKPITTAAQPAKVYHISYPSVAYNSNGTIANFPDEAEYLVVLYAACKSLQSAMGAMQTNAAIDTTALGAIVTELNKVDDIIVEASNKIDAYYTSIGDIDDTTELWDNTNKRFTVVRDALLKAQNLVDGATMAGDTEPESIQYWLNDEDPEMAQATISAANLELSRASSSINEINGIIASYNIELSGVNLYLSEANAYISQAQGYIGEINARMKRDDQKYKWYESQYNKLQQNYMQGIQALKGDTAPPRSQQ